MLNLLSSIVLILTIWALSYFWCLISAADQTRAFATGMTDADAPWAGPYSMIRMPLLLYLPSGNPTAVSVLRSFQVTENGFRSELARVSRTIYAARTTAGGAGKGQNRRHTNNASGIHSRHALIVCSLRFRYFGASQLIIHFTPNLSVTIPNASAQ
jgi:hypothetical protein